MLVREPVAASRQSPLILGLRTAVVLPGALALALLASPIPAVAHLRSGTVAVDYRASVARADTAAYSAQIFQSDRALSVAVKGGHVVMLLGYLGEPVFRLDDAGLWVSAASPTAVVLRLVKKSQRIVASTPRWRLQRGRHSVVWQDARTQGLPAGVSRGTWRVPLMVDGRRVQLQGELRRFHAPALWSWGGVLAVLLAVGVSPLVLGRRDLVGSAAIVCGVVAAVASFVILVAFALDAYASPGTWILALDAIAFLGVGVWGVLRGPEHLHVAAAIGLGLVGLAVALFEGAIFLHPVVLAILPATALRIADVVAMAAGLDAAALGGLFYLQTATLMPGEASDRGLAADPGGATPGITSRG
jgi:hypothetical protein